MQANTGERQPLDGVSVVEIAGGVAAAFASRLLAGYGAEVTRVEGLSDMPPLTDAEELYLVTGKRRVDADRIDVRALALEADIVVEEGTPGRLDHLGASSPMLFAAKPSIVAVSISPFGQSGPYRTYKATNLVSFAMGGIMSLTGDYHRSPLVSGGSQAQYFGGLHAFSAAVTTYLGAVLQGEGDWLDISLQECAAGSLELYGARVEAWGDVVPTRLGNQTVAEWGIYPCADGYAGVFTLQRQVPALFEALDDPTLVEEGFLDPMHRMTHHEELAARLYVFMAGHTKQELLAIGAKHKVPMGVVMTPLDLIGAKDPASRGFWDEIASPGGDGTIRIPGPPIPGLQWRAPDRLHEPGEDTDEVKAQLEDGKS